MSLEKTLKFYFRNTKIWTLIRKAGYYFCIICSFCLGWCSYSKMRAFFKEFNRSLPVTSYNRKRIMTLLEANELIGRAIEDRKPFMVGRYGSTELNAVWRVREDGKGFITPYSEALHNILHYSGFFPEDKDLLIRFAKLMQEATYQLDLMGVWFRLMEEWMLKTFGNNPEYCYLRSMDPFFAPNPWSAKLEGKKVLVIHPFDNTIQAQYKKRELLFPGKNVLPEFHLRTVKAVQTIAGNKDERFATWFEALDYMYNEAMKEYFDVALIGCGAYGFPLAARLKQAGKIAIHMGGVTQLLFGIKGRRWEAQYKGAYLEMIKNPAWVYPSDDEKPKGFKTIEGGCYW